MECAVIEFARNVCNLGSANSTEFAPDTPHPVIDLMPNQQRVTDLGGTMRLGSYPCILKSASRAMEAYGSLEIHERHRHRYELNNQYRETLVEHGMSLAGLSPDQVLVEMVEIKEHPWFVASQFHPEFKSGPSNPHPLFREFIRAAWGKANESG